MSQWIDRQELSSYMARQRWFGQGKDEVAITEVKELAWLSDPAQGLGVRFEIVRAGALFNVPLSYRQHPREDLSYGFIGAGSLDGEVFYVYDALHDPEARSILLAGFAEDAAHPSEVEYSRLGDFAIEQDADSVLMSAEQSNTSVIVGDALVKFFRKLSPGRNPDIEVQAALTRLGSEEISPLLGWITSGDIDLAMVGVYERTATDGWESARASVRALQDDAVRAREAGGDFAGESERLGTTLAVVHEQMRQTLPTGSWGSAEVGAFVHRLTERLDAAVQMQPSVAAYADRVRKAYAAVDSSVQVPVQRVHGDFHLGQTLRTTSGWMIIDFEGEPAQPLEDRVRLDSVARDIAGLLRSLDYAAHSVAIVSGIEDTEYIDDWVRRNRIAFLRGYGHEASDAALALLHAYEIDKALYEVVYESNYRPDWLPIPLGALERLL
ncbi:phosphotransferase [Demequina sp. TTPB684]|uniref:maltokinase N-terminal cap-like domain-containing protein n=1 Tax=unclassified Demequina TaxID=2620311 RepID=UPI001CF191F7|nr:MULTISPECIES: phosphotransferase [unclassified Demequina]MCB2414027.1 phosphotransferase [Demequina sp. TTPB684]UPU89092.1 phosphotransferase [Demequina sp. TMPB413]